MRYGELRRRIRELGYRPPDARHVPPRFYAVMNIEPKDRGENEGSGHLRDYNLTDLRRWIMADICDSVYDRTNGVVKQVRPQLLDAIETRDTVCLVDEQIVDCFDLDQIWGLLQDGHTVSRFTFDDMPDIQLEETS